MKKIEEELKNWKSLGSLQSKRLKLEHKSKKMKKVAIRR